tara:strand:- start:279 stop:425 length:147 start_codon:yes stop_codon:yes gene_type:complete
MRVFSVPDGADREKVIRVVRACPSGSLVYKLDEKLQGEFFSEPEVFVS